MSKNNSSAIVQIVSDLIRVHDNDPHSNDIWANIRTTPAPEVKAFMNSLLVGHLPTHSKWYESVKNPNKSLPWISQHLRLIGSEAIQIGY